MPPPSQEAVRALLLECLSLELVRGNAIALRFALHKTTVSRFKDRMLDWPAPKLMELDAYLRRVRRVAGQGVEPTTVLRQRLAEMVLQSLPPSLLGRAGEVLALPACDGSKIELVQRALLLHAVRRGKGNMTVAGQLLATHRKMVVRRSGFDRSLDDSPGRTMDPRFQKERTRREQVAAALLRVLPPIVRSLAREFAAVPSRRGSRLVLVEHVLLALSLQQSAGDIRAAPNLLGESRERFGSRWRRMARLVPTASPERVSELADIEATPGRAQRPSQPRPSVSNREPSLHARLVDLAIEFARAILAAAGRAPLAELWGGGEETFLGDRR